MLETLFGIGCLALIVFTIYAIVKDGKASDKRHEEKKQQADTIAGLPAVALSEVVPVRAEPLTSEQKALAAIGKAIDESSPDQSWIEIRMSDKGLDVDELKADDIQASHSRADIKIGSKNVDIGVAADALAATIKAEKPTMEEISVGGRNEFKLPASADIRARDDLEETHSLDLPSLMLREGVVIQAQRYVVVEGGTIYVANDGRWYDSESFEFFRPGSTKELSNTGPDKVHAIAFDSPEKLADHCNAVAEREERDIKIRAAAREKYL